VSIQAGSHRLGPEDGALRVKTGRHGAAAKAGHDLIIDVTSWEATLEVGEDSGPIGLKLVADPGSLRVRQGTGGMQSLSDEDKAAIQRTIDDEVLKGEAIEFRSTCGPFDDGGRLSAKGDLTMAGTSHPVEFELSVGPEGRISGAATVRQTEWGIKPYSALFGALKVADEVEVAVEADLA
jgi:hypothetical protein